MNRRFLLADRIITIIAWLVLAIGLIKFIIAWKDLPDYIGMHFDANGNFDEVESKNYGFYPFIVASVFMALLLLAGRYVKKMNIGIALDEKGDMLFRSVILATFDIVKIGLCIFALNWSHAVENQQPKNDDIDYFNVLFMMLLSFIVCPIVLVIIRKKHAPKSKTEDGKTKHKITRALCWSVSAISVLICLVMWERTPSDKPTSDPFASIYYGDLGGYAPKYLSALPVLMCFLVTAAGGLIIKKLGDKKGSAFIKTADDVRFILVLMFFMRLLFIPESSFGLLNYGFFILLCAVSVAVYLIKKRLHKE